MKQIKRRQNIFLHNTLFHTQQNILFIITNVKQSNFFG